MTSVEHVPPFNLIDERARRQYIVRGWGRSYNPGSTVWYQGDIAGQCAVVTEGTVRSVMYRSDESVLVLGRVGPGDWIGVAEVVLRGPYLCDTSAAGDCRLTFFSAAVFEDLLGHAEAKNWAVRYLARLHYASFAGIEQTSPYERLYNYLTELANAAGRPKRRIPVTQADLADATGVSRETINRTLSRMRDDGLVRTGRGWIEVIEDRSL